MTAIERDSRIPDLVSKAEAAEILNISHQAVYKMVAKGRLKGAQVGTTWVFRRSAVEAMKDREKLVDRYGSCPACGVTKGEFPGIACSDPDGWHARTYPEPRERSLGSRPTGSASALHAQPAQAALA